MQQEEMVLNAKEVKEAAALLRATEALDELVRGITGAKTCQAVQIDQVTLRSHAGASTGTPFDELGIELPRSVAIEMLGAGRKAMAVRLMELGVKAK